MMRLVVGSIAPRLHLLVGSFSSLKLLPWQMPPELVSGSFGALSSTLLDTFSTTSSPIASRINIGLMVGSGSGMIFHGVLENWTDRKNHSLPLGWICSCLSFGGVIWSTCAHLQDIIEFTEDWRLGFPLLIFWIQMLGWILFHLTSHHVVETSSSQPDVPRNIGSNAFSMLWLTNFGAVFILTGLVTLTNRFLSEGEFILGSHQSWLLVTGGYFFNGIGYLFWGHCFDSRRNFSFQVILGGCSLGVLLLFLPWSHRSILWSTLLTWCLYFSIANPIIACSLELFHSYSPRMAQTLISFLWLGSCIASPLVTVLIRVTLAYITLMGLVLIMVVLSFVCAWCGYLYQRPGSDEIDASSQSTPGMFFSSPSQTYFGSRSV
ncbi:uncharacterized protein LOC131879609 isoform X2 [Tigriopus californicus]|uniref:uncharacterized protein LOC131879609 isoform X2 n=1 Tax=Tigriopus californicus TaxID=6832 RepID=UPI0027D9FB49|nr:uncharacterized protein LOC131879609 isoform X2 [Tigriopus californicus]